jgi:hypothetical protein
MSEYTEQLSLEKTKEQSSLFRESRDIAMKAMGHMALLSSGSIVVSINALVALKQINHDIAFPSLVIISWCLLLVSTVATIPYRHAVSNACSAAARYLDFHDGDKSRIAVKRFQSLQKTWSRLCWGGFAAGIASLMIFMAINVMRGDKGNTPPAPPKSVEPTAPAPNPAVATSNPTSTPTSKPAITASGNEPALPASLPGPSDPTELTTAKGFMGLAEVKASPADFLGFAVNARGNAGDDYKKAADFYEANKDKFGKLDKQMADFAKDQAKAPDAELVQLAEKLDALVASGTTKASMEYALVHTPGQLQVGWKYEPARTLALVGNALDNLASYYGYAHDPEKGLPPARHMFMLGRHMMQERACGDMVVQGMDTQGTALATLGGLYETPTATHKKELAAIDAYNKDLGHVAATYKKKYAEVWRKLLKPERGDIGNMLNMAEHDEDRAWRVQMIFALGILNTASQELEISRADAAKIRQLLDRYAASKDKCEAAAAAAAKTLNMDQVRQLGNKM